MKSLKRLTASMLCAAMLISMLPTSAFALGEGDDQDPPVEVSASAEPSAEVSMEPSGELSADASADPSAPLVPTESASPEGGADVELLGVEEDDGDIEVQYASVDWSDVKINETTGRPEGTIYLTNVSTGTDVTFTITFLIKGNIQIPDNEPTDPHAALRQIDGQVSATAQASTSKDAFQDLGGFIQYQIKTSLPTDADGTYSLDLSSISALRESESSFGFTSSKISSQLGEGYTLSDDAAVGVIFFENNEDRTDNCCPLLSFDIPTGGDVPKQPAVLAAQPSEIRVRGLPSSTNKNQEVVISNTVDNSTAIIESITHVKTSSTGTIGEPTGLNLGDEIAGGATKTITVPIDGWSRAGDLGGYLHITYDDGTGTGTIKDLYIGIAAGASSDAVAVLTVLPSSTVFTDTTTEETFTITNNGTADATVTEDKIGLPSGYEVVVGSLSDETVAQGKTVTFKAKATASATANSPQPATLSYTYSSSKSGTATFTVDYQPTEAPTEYEVIVHTFVDKKEGTADGPRNRADVSSVAFYDGEELVASGEKTTYTGEYKANLVDGTYSIYVNGFDTKQTVTVNGAAPAVENVFLYTIAVATDLPDDTTVKIYKSGDTTSTGTSMVVPKGTDLYVNINTTSVAGYKWDGWSTESSRLEEITETAKKRPTAKITLKAAELNTDGGATITAKFSAVAYSAIVSVTLDEDTSPWGGASVTVKNSGGGVVATKATDATTGQVTFENLSSAEYTFEVADVYGTVTKATVDQENEPVTINCYTIQLKTDPADGSAGKVKFNDETDDQYAASKSRVYYKGIDNARKANAKSETNYSFKKWVNDSGSVENPSVDLPLRSINAAETYTAYFESGVYSGSVGVTWNNGNDPGDGSEVTVALYEKGADTSSATAVKTETLKKDITSASWTDLTAGKSYDVYVTVNGSDTVKYATTLGQGTGESTDITIPLASAKATADGEGTVTLSATNYTDKATSGTTPATLWVVSGTEVTWTAAADTNYKITQWDSEDDTDTSKKGTPSTAEVAHTVKFERMTAQLTLNFKEQPVSESVVAHTFDGNVVATDSKSEATTNAVNGTSTTFTLNVGETYTISVGGVDISGTVSPTDETALSKDITWYEVKVVGSPDSKGFVAMADTAIATQPTEDKNTSGYYLPTETVYVAAGVQDSNYEFTSWSSGVTADATDTWKGSYTVGEAAATLTATFSRVSYSQEITVRVNGTGVDGLTVTADGNGTDPRDTTAGGGKVTLSLKNAEAPYTIKVSTSDKTFVGTFELTKDKVDGSEDQLPALVLDFYDLTVKTDNKDNGNTVQQGSETAVSGTATSTVAYLVKTTTGGTESTLTQTVALKATATDDYRFDKWTATGVDAPTNTTGSFNYTMTAAATTLVANFQHQFTVTKAVDQNADNDDHGDYTATVAAPAGEIGNHTHPGFTGGNAQVDEGSYVTLSAPTPDEGYRFDK